LLSLFNKYRPRQAPIVEVYETLLTNLILASILIAPPAQGGQDVLDKVVAKLSKEQSVSGKLAMTSAKSKEVFDFAVLRPHYFKIDAPRHTELNNGRMHYFLEKTRNEYMANLASRRATPMYLKGLEPVLNDGKVEYKAVGKAEETKFDGKPALKVRISPDEDNPGIVCLFVAPGDYKLLGFQIDWENGTITTGTYQNMSFKTALKPDDFDWKAPPGATKKG
jgi:outer membrane lipoprotein-sorting protein